MGVRALKQRINVWTIVVTLAVLAMIALATGLTAGLLTRNARAAARGNTIPAVPPQPLMPPGEYFTSELVHPAPNINTAGSGQWAVAAQKARAFVANLTLEELVNITTGVDLTGRCVGSTGAITRLNFTGFCLQDGPLGVRLTDYTSAYPAAINVAATFDKTLMRQRGAGMGKEFRGKGVNVALGPMMNLMRAPAAGRNWEGFGGDAYLSGIGARETVLGIQEQGVIACAKHYIGNEQEHFRGGSATQASSSNIDDRTLHELYAWPFADAVHAGVGSVMCAYNRINQTYACENSKLLNGVLKTEMGFQGFVVSDWAATESGDPSSLGGLDMNMPGFKAYGAPNSTDPVNSIHSWWGRSLLDSVNTGTVPLSRVQDMVSRVFAAYYYTGQDQDYPPTNFDIKQTESLNLDGSIANEHVDVQADHHELIREIGAASTVLLKNVNATLPLNATSFRRWGVFGSDAGTNQDGINSCPDRNCDQGTLAMGWGSGSVNFPYLVDPFSAISAHIRGANPSAAVEAIFNDYNYVMMDVAAKAADVCLAFVNADSGETYFTVDGNVGDRNNLTLWHNGDDLIGAVASRCANTVVIAHAVGPVIVEPWIEHPNVTAVLWAGLPGQESGNAIVDVLFGAVNPSARLPYTIGRRGEDYAAQLMLDGTYALPQIDYTEGLYIDYRHFDKEGIVPRFEYGFGLSYTTFTYRALSISTASATGTTAATKRRLSSSDEAWFNDVARRQLAENITASITSSTSNTTNTTTQATTFADLFDTVLSLSFTVRNTGAVAGHEVAQLYLSFPESAGEPVRVLRGFERILLQPDADGEVEMSLRRRDVSVWDVVSQRWTVPSGTFTAWVGASSRDLRLNATFVM